jgi:DNA polymerase-3 subunit delta
LGAITAERLEQALARGRRGGVFFLYGDEEYLKERMVRVLVDAHTDPAVRDFNVDQLRGASVEPDTLASICRTPPMVADWRVVVVREAQALAATAGTRAVLESLVKAPVPGLALILVAHFAEKSRARIWDTVRAAATSVEFAGLSEADTPGWLIEQAAAAGVEMDAGAARALAAAVGTGLGVLTQELAKLIDFVGGRRRITRRDVADAVGAVPRADRWAWIDSVGEGRFADARSALPDLFQGAESGVGLLIGLGTHLIRIGVASTGGERALYSVLPPYQHWLVPRIARQASRWTGDSVEAALEDCLRADRLLKSASLDETQVLDELMLRLQGRADRVAA